MPTFFGPDDGKSSAPIRPIAKTRDFLSDDSGNEVSDVQSTIESLAEGPEPNAAGGAGFGPARA
jgi:hypothetical protein